jgi:hypothetical protein
VMCGYAKRTTLEKWKKPKEGGGFKNLKAIVVNQRRKMISVCILRNRIQYRIFFFLFLLV